MIARVKSGLAMRFMFLCFHSLFYYWFGSDWNNKVNTATNATYEFGQISEFIAEHRGEIVILDFNHFYHMDSQLHSILINQLEDV